MLSLLPVIVRHLGHSTEDDVDDDPIKIDRSRV